MAEDAGELAEAADAYARYLNRTDRAREVVSALIQRVSRRLVQEEVRAAVLSEPATVATPENAVAVPPFTNVSGSVKLAPLSRGLSSVMVTDLSQVAALRVLERNRIQFLLDELRLAGAVDPTTAPQVGRLLGVRRFAQGAFAADETTIQLDGFIVGSDGSLERSVGRPARGPVPDVLRLEKAIVFQTLDSLGVEVTDDERARISRIPTNSLEAFLAYSRGLELEDLGRWEDAARAYRRALELDPGFQEARDRAALCSVGEMDTERLIFALLLEGAYESDWDTDRTERVDRTGIEVGGVSATDEESGTTAPPGSSTDAQREQTVVEPGLPDYPKPPGRAGGVR